MTQSLFYPVQPLDRAAKRLVNRLTQLHRVSPGIRDEGIYTLRAQVCILINYRGQLLHLSIPPNTEVRYGESSVRGRFNPQVWTITWSNTTGTQYILQRYPNQVELQIINST
jgi:hypothetical protein